ncbi:hypothetical protein E5676_scaffold148G00140 [Cucumis melo var. makuwa]|uniref:Uncharacterized protein n=1 Tax=Cucumis melo var. makuwa TaxID=1194695 RepID=A0A5D3BXB2_CUCMM|nr:hypothetical protein E5676_scaffold148G00140 [Cucumis melo var. makuwa]
MKVGQWCNPLGDPTSQLPCALRVYSPVNSHTRQTPWCVFQDGSNGEPTSRCQERVDVEACQKACVASHNWDGQRIHSSMPQVDWRTDSSLFHIRLEHITRGVLVSFFSSAYWYA